MIFGIFLVSGSLCGLSFFIFVLNLTGSLNFTALHVLHAIRSRHDKAALSVRQFVCLSDKRVKEACAHILIPHERMNKMLSYRRQTVLQGAL